MKWTWRGRALGAIALLVALVAPARAANVLVVIADDLGVDKVGAYARGFDGYEDAALYLPATPTLDAQAAAGLTFTRAWADPVCSPSRFSLQTGQHAFRAGIGRPLGDGEAGPDWSTWSTLAGGFTEGGYATALFGKWHIGAALAAGDHTLVVVPGLDARGRTASHSWPSDRRPQRE